MPPKGTDLHFDISSSLKTVLGRDLITDEQVAIFELVKNSYDAKAKTVRLFFDADSITVVDDGEGMSLKDIQTKWLFVAYSAKRAGAVDKASYRDKVGDRQHFAGSKGIGRFSSDRLGSVLELQTRAKSESSGPVHAVMVDWDDFDQDQRDKFDQISVTYQKQTAGFSMPNGGTQIPCGTIVRISDLRRAWDRPSLLKLKAGLAKLINPFGADVDRFKIFIAAPGELDGDQAEKAKAKKSGEDVITAKLVNGEVRNPIFRYLRDKTTAISLSLDEKGEKLETTLVDRGELVYKIRQPNPFPLLAASEFRCELFFLNFAAKQTFTKRVGLSAVNFGSVFLFRNGFRVFPVGEPADDWWRIDARKQQGYRRFLGSRELIGRVDVEGDDERFQEASSRNDGLIWSPAVEQLRVCFRDYCLKRLERYVIPVTFADKADKHEENISRLLTAPGQTRVTSAVASLVDDDEIELLEYSDRLIRLVDERTEGFEESLTSLRTIAEKTADKSLIKKIEKAEERFAELRKSEAEARAVADAERKAKEEAQARALRAETVAVKKSAELDEERKRNVFLTSLSSLDVDTIINMHHQITIYSVDLQQRIENFMFKLRDHTSVSTANVLTALDQVSLLNKKILAVSKFATKANFRMESEKIEGDLGDYITQYIEGVAREFAPGGMRIGVISDGKPLSQSFKPMDVAIVIDNLVSNARKAKASRISFDISHPERNIIDILVSDNGSGISEKIGKPDRIFEKGVTTTHGSGLGLYHVRQVLGTMGGSIRVEETSKSGTSLIIRIAK